MTPMLRGASKPWTTTTLCTAAEVAEGIWPLFSPKKTMFSPELCYTTKTPSQLRTSNTAIPSSQEKYLPWGALRSLSYVCKELGLTGEVRRERSRPADGVGCLAASPASAPAGFQHLQRHRQHKCLTGGTPEGAFWGREGGRLLWGPPGPVRGLCLGQRPS